MLARPQARMHALICMFVSKCDPHHACVRKAKVFMHVSVNFSVLHAPSEGGLLRWRSWLKESRSTSYALSFRVQ